MKARKRREKPPRPPMRAARMVVRSEDFLWRAVWGLLRGLEGGVRGATGGGGGGGGSEVGATVASFAGPAEPSFSPTFPVEVGLPKVGTAADGLPVPVESAVLTDVDGLTDDPPVVLV